MTLIHEKGSELHWKDVRELVVGELPLHLRSLDQAETIQQTQPVGVYRREGAHFIEGIIEIYHTAFWFGGQASVLLKVTFLSAFYIL